MAMARRPRSDTPGSWHHVINRAIAKRPYFETRSDKRYFLARLASQVRAGRLEVHAYCLMTTHFHLLVRSPIGEMSEAMRRAQCSYSRYFNRRRHRDGPLIRARYFSKRVDSDAYRRMVVRYIDANAVRARVVATAAEHEFGSARSYLVGPRPPWLTSSWVMQHALGRSGAADFEASAYRTTYGSRGGEALDSLCEVVEGRMASSGVLDPLEDLVGKTPQQVRRWMVRKARLADGMKVGLPVCGTSALHRAVRRHLEVNGEWLCDRETRTWRGSRLALPGLLSELCGMPFVQIARVCGITVWCATRQVELHRRLVGEGGEYATAVSAIAHDAFEATIAN